MALGWCVTGAVGLLLGFGLGFLTLVRTGRWCPACGLAVRCLECPGQPTPTEVRLTDTSSRRVRDSSAPHFVGTRAIELSLRERQP